MGAERAAVTVQSLIDETEQARQASALSLSQFSYRLLAIVALLVVKDILSRIP
jgi:hypothetical protein